MAYTNPADAAMPYLEEIPGTITPYYQPYIDSGNQALQTLMQQYMALIQNPGSTMNNMGSGYQQSPGYQYDMNAAMNASNSAAAAGGMLGTDAHQTQSATMAADIANQDYWNYMNHVLGLYGQGMSGMQGINQMGYGASNELAQSLANVLMTQGGLAYAGQNNQNMANAQKSNWIAQMASALAGGLTGGLYTIF